MHIIIVAAAPTGPKCRQVLPQLHLPHLTRLLRWLNPNGTLTGQPHDLSPLHERIQARAHGWPDLDGLLPWAAWRAQTQLGLDVTSPENACAFLTPCHWQVHADHVHMQNPADLSWEPGESLAFMQAIQTYCTQDGIRLHWINDTTWLAQGSVFHHLATASLARVRNAPIDTWIPRQDQAKPLRRLQNEIQMLLYIHPLNQQRNRQQRSPINSFWISATGTLTKRQDPTPTCSVLTNLQHANANDDGAAWQHAWQTLDGTLLAEAVEHARAGASVSLTVCGNTRAHSFTHTTSNLWHRLRRHFHTTNINTWLGTL